MFFSCSENLVNECTERAVHGAEVHVAAARSDALRVRVGLSSSELPFPFLRAPSRVAGKGSGGSVHPGAPALGSPSRLVPSSRWQPPVWCPQPSRAAPPGVLSPPGWGQARVCCRPQRATPGSLMGPPPPPPRGASLKAAETRPR